MRVWRWLGFAAAAALLLVLTVGYWGTRHSGPSNPHAVERLGPLESRGEARPNVILILLDTTRADHLGVYGWQPDSTPFLTELARRSAVFDRAFSVSSWTAPATASVFTGQYPWTHGIVDGFRWHERQMEEAEASGEPLVAINSFASETRTMPERFRELGYSTVGLSANINIGPEIGFDRGFDRFVRERANVLEGIPGALGAAAELLEDMLYLPSVRRPIGTARDFRARLEEWKVELEDAAPYFLYAHLNDPHVPYVRRYPFYRPPDYGDEDPKQQRLEQRRANYLSEIEYVDRQIEKILGMEFVDDETLLVVVSDHGEEFGDHGGHGHARGLHAELNRVVVMIHGPRLGIMPARLDDVNVSLIDVLPTMLDLVGAPVPPEVEGRSLAPLLTGDSDAASLREALSRRVLFAHRRSGGEWLAAVEGPWKLIRDEANRRQLFNLELDPGESEDRSSEEPAITRRLTGLLEPFDSPSLWQPAAASTFAPDDSLREQLRALGYVE